jgi:hypothetical protein
MIKGHGKIPATTRKCAYDRTAGFGARVCLLAVPLSLFEIYVAALILARNCRRQFGAA